MIKTIDEAVHVLNEKQHRDMSWRPSGGLTVEGFIEGQEYRAFVLMPSEAVAIARSLNGDYEALASKLERVREAAGAVDREFKWMLTTSLQYRSVFGPTLEALSTALAETEEEKADSESTACGMI